MKTIMTGAVGLAVAGATVLAGAGAAPAALAAPTRAATALAAPARAAPRTEAPVLALGAQQARSARPDRSARQARTGQQAPAAPAGRRRPVAYDCLGWRQGRVKTATIALSCFGTVVVKVAAWRYWTGVSARTATATLGVDACQPNCGSGKFRKYAATVTLYRVRPHNGTAYYSRLKLQYRHGGRRTYIYRWAKYPGATIPVWIGGPTGRS
jgi:hypothetical protein